MNGIDCSQQLPMTGQVIVVMEQRKSDERIERVLTNDPMMGIFRHARRTLCIPHPALPRLVAGDDDRHE